MLLYIDCIKNKEKKSKNFSKVIRIKKNLSNCDIKYF